MTQKILFTIILVFSLFLISGCAQTEPDTPLNKTTIEVPGAENYSSIPMMECVECENGETWNNKTCCTDNFTNECTSKNGAIVFTDLHPVFTALKSCIQKAPDAGNECASGEDCLSTVCNLAIAIDSDKCRLVKKTQTGEKNQYGNEEFYTATYSCNTDKPGECTETINNRINMGGVWHHFSMEGKILTEVKESGPIS